jgi:glycerate kinase
LQALGARFLDAHGEELPPGGGPLNRLERIDFNGVDARLKGVRLIIGTDVTSPLYGKEGASRIFGPQKGATDEKTVEELDSGLRRLAEVASEGGDQGLATKPGAGAAGGLGFGLLLLGAQGLTRVEMTSGFEFISRAVDLRGALKHANLAVTGEGSLDRQSLVGKVPPAVAKMAAKLGVPTIIIPGRLAPDVTPDDLWGATILPLTERAGKERAMKEPESVMAEIAAEVPQHLPRPRNP